MCVRCVYYVTDWYSQGTDVGADTFEFRRCKVHPHIQQPSISFISVRCNKMSSSMSRRIDNGTSGGGDADKHETNAIVVVQHGRDGMQPEVARLAADNPILPTPVIVYILEYADIVGTREIFPLFDRSINSFFRPPENVEPTYIRCLATIHCFYYRQLRKFAKDEPDIMLCYDRPWWKLSEFASRKQLEMIKNSFMEIHYYVDTNTDAEQRFFCRLKHFFSDLNSLPTMETTSVTGARFITNFYRNLGRITVVPNTFEPIACEYHYTYHLDYHPGRHWVSITRAFDKSNDDEATVDSLDTVSNDGGNDRPTTDGDVVATRNNETLDLDDTDTSLGTIDFDPLSNDDYDLSKMLDPDTFDDESMELEESYCDDGDYNDYENDDE